MCRRGRELCRSELNYTGDLLLRLVNRRASTAEGWRRGIREREREGKALRNYQTFLLFLVSL